MCRDRSVMVGLDASGERIGRVFLRVEQQVYFDRAAAVGSQHHRHVGAVHPQFGVAVGIEVARRYRKRLARPEQ